MAYGFLIFDFDGTVVDTGEGIIKSLQYSFAAMGREIPTENELKRFIGPPVYYSYTHFYGVSEDEVGEYIKKYRERYKEKGIRECRIYDGMSELLDALKRNGIRVGIASSKPEHLIYGVADYLGITDKFDAIVGVKVDDSNHSTKAGLIEECIRKLGATDKSSVLMVGDRMYDIDGAKDAGVRSCAALWGYGSENEFIEHNADYIVNTADEILKISLE